MDNVRPGPVRPSARGWWARPVVGVLMAITTALAVAAPVGAQAQDLASWVDPTIGTLPPGFTNPGPVRPHGMVHLGPDTEGPFNYGGYSANNLTITGFSHIHMSAGVFQGGQFPLMPVVGEVLPFDLTGLPSTPPLPAYASPFTKVGEVAEAGYYAVDLLRYGVRAELTATERVGVHRYTFPPAVTPRLVFHPGRDLKGVHDAVITVDDESTILASMTTSSPEHTLYAALRVDRPITVSSLDGSAIAIGGQIGGPGVGVVIDLAGDPVVRVDVGVSFVDPEGAVANLEAESDLGDFDAVRADARASWNEVLEAILVDGGTSLDRTTFYTALYRAQTFPSLLSDADGRYPGPDDVIRRDVRPHYTNFSMWDSYRGQNALLAVIDPERYRDFLGSLRDYAAQGGRLPRWQLANRDPGYMSGNPVIPLVAAGICRDVADPELEADLYRQAWELVALERPAELDQLGYLPMDPPANPIELVEGGGSLAGRTLEYGVADAALALLAHRRGDAAGRTTAMSGSARWRNLLDPDTRWVRPRDADGAWSEPFLPESGYGFQEGTSWQYSWLVMHDLAGLIDAMGGPDSAIARLDTMFGFPATASIPIVWPKIQNQATVFGIFYFGNQYAPGNEHDLHVPFVYNWAGAPWKSQAVARGVASLYTPTLDGLPGNDDLGALSGWLVWTMLGLHPTVPGAPAYTLASPVFERAVIRRPAGEIVIEAPGASPTTRFVTAASLDGAMLDGPWITEADLRADGSILRFDLASQADPSWGASHPPPSFSTHDLDAFGCVSAAVADPVGGVRAAEPVARSPLPTTGGASAIWALAAGSAVLILRRPRRR